MKLLIFAVRDRATDMFGNPMFLMADGQAIRSFTDEINNGDVKNPLFMHPDDYDLYKLGEFDTSTGLFETGRPEQVSIGKMVKVRS